ncbi:hypothetical protein KGO5_03068 [Sinorhizobium sp. KGO-5]|uniref:hypothetical protein n=1 Tax=Sinorhizobium sp. KGO-5 TaxID=1470810 RepID=UPI002949B66F|nr:hypothetical protein KGO5_03068 [Sinorhizobium sp. KGO-5]
MKQKIFLMDAGVARGKTHQIVEHLATTDTKAIIGTQQHKLSLEIKERLIVNGASEDEILVISTKTDKKCRAKFRTAVASGKYRIIFADHSVVLGRYPGTEQYDLFIDEVPTIEKTVRFKKMPKRIQEVMNILFDHQITAESSYYELRLTPQVALEIEAILKEYRNEDEDSVISYNKKFINLCYAITSSQDVRVEVRASEILQWKAGETPYVTFYQSFKPSIISGYRSATIAAANIHNADFFHQWQDVADFEDHPLCENLRKDVSELKSHLIKIWFLSEEHGTLYRLNQLGYQYFLDCVADAVAAHPELGNAPYIFCTRKADENGDPYHWKYEGKGLPGIRLPSNVKGIDGFKHINIALHLAPVNPPPAIFNHKRDRYGQTSEDVKESIPYEGQYQFMARTSIRDYASDAEVHCVVLDRAAANALQRKFKCADPKPLDIGIPELWGVQVEAATSTERSKNSRARAKAIRDDHALTEQYDGFKIIHWEKKESKFLRQNPMDWWKLTSKCEEDANNLVLPANAPRPQFREGDLSDLNNHKLKGNIKSTKLAILDIDEARLPPKPLSDFLYDCGWSHFIYASRSNTADLYSFRVVIGLSEAVNAENYRRIIELVVADIATYFELDKRPKDYPIDRSKLSINSRFFSPTVPDSGHGFFIKRHIMSGGMAFEAKFLDVKWFLSRNQVFDPEAAATFENAPAPKATAERLDPETVLAKWETKPGEGKGNEHLFRCAIELKKNGWTEYETNAFLSTACERNRFGEGTDRDAKTTVRNVYAWKGNRSPSAV